MQLKHVFEHLSGLSREGGIPRGVIDEGRIFTLGRFDTADQLHGRVVEVVDGLKDQVGQPFDMHPWAFVIDVSTVSRDGVAAPLTFVEVVFPRAAESVFVNQFFATPRRFLPVGRFSFEHTSDGTKATILPVEQNLLARAPKSDTSLYPLAIAVLNTRGCPADLKRAPSVTNAKRKKQGKSSIPAHYDVDISEYITALRSAGDKTDRGGAHASPIPHLRRGHERVLPTGERIWVRSALVNVRKEGDIAFVERRTAYKR